MKIAAFALVIGPTLAFSPVSLVSKAPITSLSLVSKVASSSSSPYQNEAGVMDPTGFFDPLGLSKNIDQETFDWYRAGELKNGRAAMLFVVGYVVQEVYRFPGEIAPGLKFADIPNGVAAISAIPALGWMQIFFLIGSVDYYGFLGNFEQGKGLDLSSEEMDKRVQSELAHCRLAMLAFLELLRHDTQNYVSPGFDGYDKLITGLPFLYN